MVQGVGFRPFVAGLADEIGISGNVRNSGGIVHISASGAEDQLEVFLQRLRSDAPKESNIERIDCQEAEPKDMDPENFVNSTDLKGPKNEKCGKKAKIRSGDRSEGADRGAKKPSFTIIRSTRDHDRIRLLPVDMATCPTCERELLDPNNRRYRYPFISCTVCGPRFSILKDIPYDRDHITMDKFPMCRDCETEYRRPGDRRRHAQTIACHSCGPVLRSLERKKDHELQVSSREDALQRAIACLREGKVIAVKDIGGFHFAFRPDDEKAAKRLRVWKNRERKPFAVMFPDLPSIEKYCKVSPRERELLQSNARPIVLLRQLDRSLWPEVSAESDRMGAMLPSNPLQILLLGQVGPLVMTSGNRGGEPIAIDSSGLIKDLKDGFPDLILDHDREILTPLDDSIYQLSGDQVQILRRARGLVPNPVWISRKCKADTFASGGDLKNSFALGRDNAVYLSGHFGDLTWRACQEARERSIENMERLLDIHPEHFAGDLHPLYISSRKLLKMAGEHPLSFYQHHLSHVAGVLAECHLTGDCLGLAFDGTGYGSDGRIWGSEFLRIRQLSGEDGIKGRPAMEDRLLWQRVGSLVPIRQIGGDEGAKDGRKSLFSYLKKASEEGICTESKGKDLLGGFYFEQEWQLLDAAYRSGINAVESTSMGRLFDAAAALLEINDRNHYEGESPIRLETEANECAILKNTENVASLFSESKALESKADRPKGMGQISLSYLRKEGGLLRIDGPAILYDLMMEKVSGHYSKAELAFHFHQKLIEAIAEMTEELADPTTPIALAGGTFLNRILFQGLKGRLTAQGYKVYCNCLVPPGDGGLSLGQIYLSTYDKVEELD